MLIKQSSCLRNQETTFKKLCTHGAGSAMPGTTYLCKSSTYLKRLRCKHNTLGNCLILIRFWASCRQPQVSQLNLSSASRVSVALQWSSRQVHGKMVVHVARTAMRREEHPIEATASMPHKTSHLKLRKQLVTDELCSISRLRS